MRAAFHLDTAPQRVLARALVATLVVLSAGAASAQQAGQQKAGNSEITVTKPSGDYAGPYGQSLPGVFMNQGQPSVSQGPLAHTGSPYRWVNSLPLVTDNPDPLPWVDSYHGTYSKGVIPF
ncbi:hypothetical protein [Pseudoxanthobacter sp.]|uniref:hypothetical protein n=1 Tax=Pseudoxanthobacter sp. TaxID=1925742 RepID=UPI002FE3A342